MSSDVDVMFQVYSCESQPANQKRAFPSVPFGNSFEFVLAEAASRITHRDLYDTLPHAKGDDECSLS
ncbi:uncharacterized [Tachysurus ichikawai]